MNTCLINPINPTLEVLLHKCLEVDGSQNETEKKRESDIFFFLDK